MYTEINTTSKEEAVKAVMPLFESEERVQLVLEKHGTTARVEIVIANDEPDEYPGEEDNN